MCTECKRINCPDACPGSRRESSNVEYCCICGDAVLFGEEHYSGHGVCICGDCADTVDADDLIELCSFTDTAELLSVLGFYHAFGR